MSTTMHAHIEVKKNNQWHHFGQPNIKPNYLHYAVISGERIEDFRPSTKELIKPVCHIHELPEDMSLITKICLEQDEKQNHLHGFGMLTAEDLITLQDRMYEADPWTNRTGFDEHDLEQSVFCTYIDGGSLAAHRGWDDLRILFWYDN